MAAYGAYDDGPGWRWVFVFCAGAGLIMLRVWNRHFYELGNEKRPTAVSAVGGGRHLRSRLMLGIMLAITLRGMLRDGISTWMPTYIAEVYRVNDLNHLFFDKFTRLDQLCKDAYHSDMGITHYINKMKLVLWQDYRRVPDWESDLKQLKRLRHIRNHLAHTPGAFDEVVCTENDIDWLRDFHLRIIRQTDLLAILCRCETVSRISPPIKRSNTKPNQVKPKTGLPQWLLVAAIVCIMFSLIGLVVILLA